jgi:hypothetical protein
MSFQIVLTDLMDRTAPPSEIIQGETPNIHASILNGTAWVTAVHYGKGADGADLVEAHLI